MWQTHHVLKIMIVGRKIKMPILCPCLAVCRFTISIISVTMPWTLPLMMLVASVTATTATCPSHWKQFRNTCYWMSDFGLRLGDVANVCNMFEPGSDLVSIHDIEEDAFIAEEVAIDSDGDRTNAWIGLTRINSSSPWSWTDGSPYNYSLWYKDDPDFEAGDCVVTNRGAWGTWACRDCESSLNFMCQIAAT